MRNLRLISTVLVQSVCGLLILAVVGCDKLDVRFTKAGSSLQHSDEAQSTVTADTTQFQPNTPSTTPQPNYGASDDVNYSANGNEPTFAATPATPAYDASPYEAAPPYDSAPTPLAYDYEASAPSVDVPPSNPNAPTYLAPPVSTVPASAPEVRLRTGVALPQTLPTGTAMGFSVDYEFVGDSPRPSSVYVWVLVRGDGTRAEIPAAVMNRSAQGTLQTFITTWRPDDGPFKCHIEERTSTNAGRAISNSIDLL